MIKKSGPSSRNPVGSLLILLLALLPPVCGFSQTIEQGNLSALKEKLESQGWRVEKSANGDLIVWRAKQAGTASNPEYETGEEAASDTVSATDITSLRRRLEEQGWRVETNQDGAILAYPGSRETAENSGQTATNNTQEETRLEALKSMLEASGWEVEKNARGDLLLYPSHNAVTKPRATTMTVAASDLIAAKDILAGLGWRLQESANGNIRLYPPTKSGAKTTQEDLDTQPIDSVQAARERADAWLKAQGNDNLTVGKIRKINRLYLISIVEKTTPFRLQNQISIRINDGQVTSLLY